jgi:hypothetical protein
MRKEKSTTSSQGIHGEDVILLVHLIRTVLAAALRQDTQKQQQLAPPRDGKSVQHPVQQHLPQPEIHRQVCQYSMTMTS